MPPDNILLAKDVRYDPAQGYIMLHVPFVELPKTHEFNGVTFAAKTEFHCSLLNARVVKDALGDTPTHTEQHIVELTRNALTVYPVSFVGFQNKAYHCTKEDRQSIIVLATLNNIEPFFTMLRKELNLPDLPNPVPHVTLYTYNHPFGIGIPGKKDLVRYCQPVELSQSWRF